MLKRFLDWTGLYVCLVMVSATVFCFVEGLSFEAALVGALLANAAKVPVCKLWHWLLHGRKVMTDHEQEIVARLTRNRDKLMEELERRGGRGVALAEHIDRLDAAIDALRGELCCPCCEAQITGNA